MIDKADSTIAFNKIVSNQLMLANTSGVGGKELPGNAAKALHNTLGTAEDATSKGVEPDKLS